MRSDVKKAVRNVVNLIALEFILFPLAVWLYLLVGFHIAHIILILCYIHGTVMIYESANLILKHVKIVDTKEENTFFQENEENSDHVLDSVPYSVEPLKPEMEKAMREVFFNKKV